MDLMTPHERELLTRIDRRGKWHSVGLVAVLVWLCVLTVAVFGQSSQSWAAAAQDRQAFAPSDWPYLYYVSFDHLPPEAQVTAGKTLAFTVASFSRATVLEHQVPFEVQWGLYRLDLRGLEWDWRDWCTVLKDYPYWPKSHPPLVVRGDWLIVTLTDNFESDSGYRLLYGGKKIPQTRDEFLKFWDVSLQGSRDPLLLARIERDTDGDTPSLLNVRRIENRPTANRGYAWGTEDTAKKNFSAKTDPLENLVGNRKHDAEEWIVGIPKLSTVQGAGGASQVYLLANGQGKRQDRAPTEIVKDANELRGDPAIRNTIGCIVCHPRGINALATNDLREIIASGVDLFADYDSSKLIEQQHFADVRMAVEIARNQEDYATFVALVTGMDPATNAKEFRALVDAYDAPLSTEDVARELYLSKEELPLALAHANNGGYKLSARIAGLAHGGSVPRTYWEANFAAAWTAVQNWRNVGK